MPWPDRSVRISVLDVERRLAEEVLGALLLEGQQAALDRADRGGADPAVFERQLLRALADEMHQRAQILEVEQQQALVVGDPERDLSTPSWVSLRPSRRASSSGPISETVVRIGWPCSPNRSQNTAGQARGA